MHVVSPVRLRVPLVALAVLVAAASGRAATAARHRPAPRRVVDRAGIARPPRRPPSRRLGGTRRPVAQPRRIRRPPRPRGGRASRSRSSSTASTRRSGSTASRDGSGRLVVAEQGGTIRIVEDGRLLADAVSSTSPTGSSRAASAACSGVAFPPGFGDRAPDAVRPLLGPQRRHHDRRLRRARGQRPTLDPAASGILFTEPTSRTPTTTAAGSASTRRDAPDRPRRRRRRRRPAEPRLEPGRRSWARCCGSTSWAAGDEPYAIPRGQPVRRPRRRPPGDPPLRPAQPVPRQHRPRDRRPVDRRRRARARGRRSTSRRPAPAASTSAGVAGRGRHCYDPPTGCDPTGVTMPVTRVPAHAGLRDHRRRRLPRRRDPGAARRVPVLRQLLRDAVGDRRRARRARRRRSRCSRPVGRSARSASTTRARWS